MAWTPLEREKIDNIHHRLKAVEESGGNLRLDLRDNTKVLSGLSEDIREFKTIYSLTLYHAVARRVSNLTGSDLKIVVWFLALVSLILYALLAGYNLFSAMNAAHLLPGGV